jgi:hypothetical protein
VGQLLHTLGGRGAVLATTEAGLLPLYSDWQSLDAWGLNDPRVIAEGALTDQYLADMSPDVIMFHAPFTPLTRASFEPAGAWDRMVMTMEQFAECRGYAVAAVYAPDLSQAHYYYVKPSWPQAARFTAGLRSISYAWWGTLAPAIDMTSLAAPHAGCRD